MIFTAHQGFLLVRKRAVEVDTHPAGFGQASGIQNKTVTNIHHRGCTRFGSDYPECNGCGRCQMVRHFGVVKPQLISCGLG